MASPVFLPVSDVVRTHRWQVERFGGEPGVRDARVLEAAIAMPREQVRGAFVHPDLQAMAAAYLYHLCTARPFRTGNRRTALATALLFLSLNEVDPPFEPSTLRSVVEGISEGEHDKQSVIEFFRTGEHPTRARYARLSAAHREVNSRLLRERDERSAARSLESLLTLRTKVGDAPKDVVAAFHQTIDLLKREGESFVLIGGLATGFYGEPRMTEDIDLLVQLRRRHLMDLADRMRAEGFDIDPNEAGLQWQELGYTHAFWNGVRIDLLSAHGAFHRNVFERGEWVTLLDQRLRMSTVEDCVLMKALAWSLKDVPIAVELVERHAEGLDRGYLTEWASKLADHEGEVVARVEALLDPSLPLPPGRRG